MFLDMRSAWNHDRGRRSQGGGRSGDLTAAHARQPAGGMKGGTHLCAGVVPLQERHRRAHHGGATQPMEELMADTTGSGSPWAVAYQLATVIAREEKDPEERRKDPRAYFLKLYQDCLVAVASKGLPI